MSPRGRVGRFAALLCSLSLLAAVGHAGAEGTEPVTGGWKGKTKQGFPIYFGVREGPTVTNVRLTYRDTICGKASPKNPTLTMTVDEDGHFRPDENEIRTATNVLDAPIHAVTEAKPVNGRSDRNFARRVTTRGCLHSPPHVRR